MPHCSSGVVVEPTQSVQLLQGRDDGNECRDYLQFSAGSFSSHRYCGDELSTSERFELKIDAVEFLALFWADVTDQTAGFQLTAKCDDTGSRG